MFMQESRADNLPKRRPAVARPQRVAFAFASTLPAMLAARSITHDVARQTALKQYIALSFSNPPSSVRDVESVASRQSRIVVVDGVSAGPVAFMVCLYRAVSRRTTLVVYFSEPPPEQSRRRTRRMLKTADCVVVDGHAADLAVSEFGYAAHRITPTPSLDRYLSIEPARSSDPVRRVIVVSDLTPESGVYDLLAGLATWSAAHPDDAVELNWVGAGDLSAMLAAQPHSDNLSQVFHGSLDAIDVAALFEQGGLVAVTSVVEDVRGHVAEALAAGLPVMGSRRCSEVRRHVTDGLTGWLFDPLTPGDILDAVTRAFDTSPDRLANMKVSARDAVLPSSTGMKRPRRQDRNPADTMLSTAHPTT